MPNLPTDKPYQPLSTGLKVLLLLLPFPVILVVLVGPYAPRTKAIWGAIAALDFVIGMLLPMILLAQFL